MTYKKVTQLAKYRKPLKEPKPEAPVSLSKPTPVKTPSKLSNRDVWLTDLDHNVKKAIKNGPNETVLKDFLTSLFGELGSSDAQIERYLDIIERHEQRCRKSHYALMGFAFCWHDDRFNLTLLFIDLTAPRSSVKYKAENLEIRTQGEYSFQAIAELMLQYHENRGLRPFPYGGQWKIKGENNSILDHNREEVVERLTGILSKRVPHWTISMTKSLDVRYRGTVKRRYFFFGNVSSQPPVIIS